MLNFNCDVILTTPVAFDFGQYGPGDDGDWDLIYPDPADWSLEDCKNYLEDQGAELPDPNPWVMSRTDMLELIEFNPNDGEQADIATWSNDDLRTFVVQEIDNEALDGLDAWRETTREVMRDDDAPTPMMNYYYPLPHFNQDWGIAQAMLLRDGGSVCLVEVGGRAALALTGGGMDLSWDICHAYTLLGYLPPFHFTDLPRYAGGSGMWGGLETLDACVRTAETLKLWAEQRLRDLTNHREELANRKGD